MIIHVIPILRDNYCFLLEDNDKTCVIVDPGQVSPVRAAIETLGLKPVLILNTHHHADHVAGNLELKSLYGIEVHAPKAEQHLIPHTDRGLEAGDTTAMNLKVIATPGHTNGHISFYNEHDNALFCGDTLFSMGCGRVMEGTHQNLWDSLQRIKSLPPETKIYCGHEYTQNNGAFALIVHPDNTHIAARMDEVRKMRTNNLPTIPATLEIELKTNPFLLAENLQDFIELREKKDRF